MTKKGLLNAIEALEHLGLHNPADGRKPNHRHLKSLNDRGLLPRIKLGYRTIRYRIEDCEALLQKCISEGISLTAKPTKEAA